MFSFQNNILFCKMKFDISVITFVIKTWKTQLYSTRLSFFLCVCVCVSMVTGKGLNLGTRNVL